MILIAICLLLHDDVMHVNANSLVILDFETTGLSPDQGDRVIEVGAVRLRHGEVVDEFQQLINPGFRINSFIENYTGITNTLLKNAPSSSQVMQQFHAFIGDDNLVAHNSSFDKRFLDAEFSRINCQYTGNFSCSLLLARRLYQQAPNHKLGTLVTYKNLTSTGEFHRALFDAQMTAKLWLAMLNDIALQTNVKSVPFSLVQKLTKTAKNRVAHVLATL